MNTEKTFLLGVGAQKSGTSWLQDYLAGHPDSDMGFIKEYHIFDALHVPACEGFRNKIVTRLAGPESGWVEGDQQRAGFYEDVDRYYDYFAGLLARDRGNGQGPAKLTGDVTPSYSLLPADVMASVKQNFAKRGIRVRTIFLLRDPVERLWSHIRMIRRSASSSPNAKRRGVLKMTEAEQMLAAYRGAEAETRTRYDTTLRALDQAFQPDEVLVGFYEEMFTPGFIRQVTDFLGVSYVEPDFGKQVNPSAKTDALPEEIMAKIANHYRATYRDVVARFGDDRVSAIWPSHALLS